MKTAAKISMTALATVLFCALSLSPRVTQAQQAMPVPPPAPVAAQPAAAAAAPAPGPTSSQVSSSVKEALDSIAVPGASSSVHKDKSAEASKKSCISLDSQDESDGGINVPESVKGVVKKLNETTENVTLDNLNAAREAVIKLDVLIDIEKRLNDLSKLRKAREEEVDSLSDALPQSALSPSMGQPPSIMLPAGTAQPIAPGSAMDRGMGASISSLPSDYEVVRLVGASGSFAAQVKDTSGSTKLVRVGDKLSDGSKISGISIGGVSVTRPDKTKKTYSVKDAPAFFANP